MHSGKKCSDFLIPTTSLGFTCSRTASIVTASAAVWHRPSLSCSLECSPVLDNFVSFKS